MGPWFDSLQIEYVIKQASILSFVIEAILKQGAIHSNHLPLLH